MEGEKKMRNFNLKRLFDNSLFTKIFSIVIAIVVWTVITIIINPNQERIINNIAVNIPVAESAAGKLGLKVFNNSTQSVTVTVNGKRYKVGNLANSDIVVTADVSKIKSAGVYNLKLTATQKSQDGDYTISDISPETIKVTFDYVVTAELPLEVSAPNITAKDGYIKDKEYASSEKILLEGAQTDIEKIKRAVLVSDKKETIKETLIIGDPELILYDANNDVVSQNTITHSLEELQITVPILVQKTINLTFGYKNVPDGFPIDELKYTMSKSNLKVMASNEAIANTKEINIGYIDLRTVDVGSSFVLDVGLPSGFINTEETKKVTVKFENPDLISKTFNVKKIQIQNAPENYNVSIDTKELTNVKIVGKSSVVAKLKQKDIVAVVDLQSDTHITQAGQVSAVVKITVPNKGLVWAVGEYSVIVNANNK